jgi:Domain of unknown function (DUF4132)
MGVIGKFTGLFSGKTNADPLDSVVKRITIESTEAIYQEITLLPDEQKVQLLIKMVSALHQIRCTQNPPQAMYSGKGQSLHTIIVRMMANKIILTEDDISQLIDCFIQNTKPYTEDYLFAYIWPVDDLLGQVVKQRKDEVISDQLATTLKRISDILNGHKIGYHEKQKKRISTKIDKLLAQNNPHKNQVQAVYFYEDDFANFANNHLAEFFQTETNPWLGLMTLAKKTTGAKPSAKFLNEAKSLIEKLGESVFSNVVREWFQFIIDSKDPTFTYEYGASNFVLCANNVEMFKCIVWMCATLKDDKLVSLVGALADRCFQKIPQKGHASDALGNACLFTLYQSSGITGIAQLSRLQLRIKQNKTLKLIGKYLSEAAKNQGMTVSELEDLSVPDFGLADGIKRWLLDGYTVEIRIIGVGKTETQWYKPDGTPQKSVPTVIKETFAEEFKQLKATAKSIEQSLTAQRDRLDRMFRMNRTMSWAHFHKYYLEHPLLSFLSQKLIWNFTNSNQTITAIYLDGDWKNNHNQTVIVPDHSEVSLWHPAASTAGNTLLWRDFLLDKLIQQPIKQAYREVYLLTDAEINTKSYSNRMAAHILKQHQFSSLAKGRGWTYSLLGAWDGGDVGIAELVLESHGIYAQFWVQSVIADNAYNETGIWNYVSTDQVRFLGLESDDVLDLVDIPVVVFSEVMRDVDLFVGVASVGNDPNWRDNGGLPAYQTYWQSYSFGDLSELAKTRKAILERLIPRLKIKDVTEIKDKFVVVKGKLRTYKIHIGSTNILMEPNNQYLCIVPNQHKKDVTDKIFLPFEGDSGLSIILSKAVLLTDDDKITDPTITSQLKLK